MKTQIKTINAYCILRDFMRDEMSKDPLLDQVDQELEQKVIFVINNK